MCFLYIKWIIGIPYFSCFHRKESSRCIIHIECIKIISVCCVVYSDNCIFSYCCRSACSNTVWIRFKCVVRNAWSSWHFKIAACVSIEYINNLAVNAWLECYCVTCLVAVNLSSSKVSFALNDKAEWRSSYHILASSKILAVILSGCTEVRVTWRSCEAVSPAVVSAVSLTCCVSYWNNLCRCYRDRCAVSNCTNLCIVYINIICL